jgi:small subunit ribosomal protein S21
VATNVLIVPHPGQDAETMAKVFKRECLAAGVFKDLKRVQFYQKPSEKRRRKAAEALKRRRKAERQRRDYEYARTPTGERDA